MQLNLNQLINLVFEKPADGIVNINLLHSLLQILLDKLDFGSVPIEYVGKCGQKIEQEIANSTKQPYTNEFQLAGNVVYGHGMDKLATYDEVNHLIELHAEVKRDVQEAVKLVESKLCDIECSIGEFTASI